ncbi:MAG: hypothetical protein Q8O83_01965 [bacterium]|nr:hypothetical protein [bacterium]
MKKNLRGSPLGGPQQKLPEEASFHTYLIIFYSNMSYYRESRKRVFIFLVVLAVASWLLHDWVRDNFIGLVVVLLVLILFQLTELGAWLKNRFEELEENARKK